MDVYTDGSFMKKLTMDASGWAAIVVRESTPESYLVDVYYGVIDEKEYTKMWNVGGEVFAAIVAMDLADNSYKPENLHIYHDYQGLFGWANGKWQPKNSVTRGFRDYVTGQRRFRSILFHAVKGHTGLLLNEVADFYAGLGLREYTKTGITRREIIGKIIPKNQKFSG